MKTALIISGQPRSVEQTFPYIKENILDINTPDVFIHVWNDRAMVGRQPVSSGGVVASEPIRPDIMAVIDDLYKPTVMQTQTPMVFDELDYNENKYPQIKPRNSLSQRYSVWKSFDLLTGRYDAIIRMRFDWAIQTPIDVTTLPLDCITLPGDCPHHGGVNDQFAVGNYSNMKVYSELYQNIRALYLSGIPFCDEILLGQHLVRGKIPVNPEAIQYHLQRDVARVGERHAEDVL
jgi:hypothetical protein